MRHLSITDGGDGWFFVDPTNTLYDALDLNSQITQLFAPATSYAFRDRIFGLNGRKDGLGDLFQVLGKWNGAVYMPPKMEQAFNQGGTFVFKGGDTVYAHYDASAGAHVSVDGAVQIALREAAAT